MARSPIETVPGVRQSTVQSETFSGAGGTAAAFYERPSGGLQVAADVASFLAKQSAHLDAYRTRQSWEEETTSLQERIIALRRETTEDDPEYLRQVEEISNRWRDDFVARVPLHLQSEYSQRASSTVQALQTQELQFDLQRKDGYYKRTLDEKLETYRGRVAEDFTSLDSSLASVAESIELSGLSADDKAAYRRAAVEQLQTSAYAARFRDEYRNTRYTPSTVEDYVAKVTRVESGGNPTARNPNSSALGLGQFIESTWRSFIQARHPELLRDDYLSLREDPELSREAIAWYAEQNGKFLDASGLPVTDGTLYLAHFLGPDGARSVLSADPSAQVSSLLSTEAVEANKSILSGKTAAEVIQWANGKVGSTASYASMDFDVGYEGVPFETRMEIRDKVARQVGQEIARDAALAENQRKEAFERLINGVRYGDLGLPDITNGQESGVVQSATELNQLMTAYQRRNKQDEVGIATQQKLQDPNHVWNPVGDRKSLNWLYEKAPAGEDEQGNLRALKDFVTARDPGAAPIIQQIIDRTQQLPRDLVGDLSNMSQSPDWATAKYAYQQLAAAREYNNEAFRRAAPEDLQKQVAKYNALARSVPEEELARMMQPPRDPALRNQQAALAAEASKYRRKPDVAKKLNFEEIAGDISPSQQSWGRDYLPVNNTTRARFMEEYNTLFDEFFASTAGDAKAADAAAREMLGQTWGWSPVNGRSTFMKYPPEHFSVPRLNEDGSFDYSWMGRQAAADLQLADGQSYELISDNITAEAANRNRRILQRKPGEEPQDALMPVSYGVVIVNADGTVSPHGDRIYFDPNTEEVVRGAQKGAEISRLRAMRTMKVLQRYEAAKTYVATGGAVPIPPELDEEIAALEEQLAATRPQLVPHEPVAAPDDLMIAPAKKPSPLGTTSDGASLWELIVGRPAPGTFRERNAIELRNRATYTPFSER